MDKVKLSVIIPVHNAGRYLQECLDSISSQTFVDFTVLAIDDASDDNSLEILTNHAAKDLRFIICQNPYCIGAARTRNIGIQLSSGEYLSILDADDIFEPYFFQEMLLRSEKEQADIAICNLFWHDEATGREITNRHPHNVFLNGMHYPFSGNDYPSYIFSLFLPAPFLKCLRRDFVIENQLTFQDLPNCNDLYFHIMSLSLAKKIIYVPYNFVHYRQNNPGSISTSRQKNPYCLYLALRQARLSLIERQKFAMYAKAYFAFAINNLEGYILSLPPALQDELIEFYRERGFGDLGMNGLRKENFPDSISFAKWQYLSGSQSGVDRVDQNDFHKISYQCFFEEMKSRNYQMALWGFGLLGHTFLEMARICNFPLVEIYDRNEALWDKAANPPVVSFEQRKAEVNAIIITNAIYVKEILLEIKNEAADIHVFDFSAYQSGITVEECEI